MMRKRIGLLVGLTAVSILILLTSCTTPTTPEATATAVPPTPTSQPTTTTAPTATPEPTATPTAEEQANQRLLNDGRFTTLLDELTQEIGRDLSDDEQAQVLALARALWLPGQTDASDWLPDPAGVTLHWRPALDGREGPVLRVVATQPDSPYAAGVLIFWQAERLLTLTPSQPGFNIEYTTVHKNGQSFSTWVETDANGELIRFVDNTNPGSDTYFKWVNPQDLREDGSFSIFTIQDTDPNNGDAPEFWWTNGGELVRIATYHDGRPMQDVLNDPSFQNTMEFVTVTVDGREYLATALTTPPRTDYYYNPDTETWIEYQVSTVNAHAEAMKVIENSQSLVHESVRDGLPMQFRIDPGLKEDLGNIWALITDPIGVHTGLEYFIEQNKANNNGQYTLPIHNKETNQVEYRQISEDALLNVTIVPHAHEYDWLTHNYGVLDPVRFGIFINQAGNLELVIKASPVMSSTDTIDHPSHVLGMVQRVLLNLTRNVNSIPLDGRPVQKWQDIFDTDDLQIAFGVFIEEADRYLPSILFFDDRFSPTERPWYIHKLWDEQLPNK